MSNTKDNILFPIRDYLEKWLKMPVYIMLDEGYLCVIYNSSPVCKILKDEPEGYIIEFTNELKLPDYPTSYWKSTLSGVESCISSRIRYYEEKKGQNTMVSLLDLRDYLHKEIGDAVTVIYDRSTGPNIRDRIRIKRNGCLVCSIYNTKESLFKVIFYDPFICRSVGFSSVVNLTFEAVPKAVKNRINICDSIIIDNGDNRIAVDIDVSDDAIQKEIYMMSARGSGKTKYVSDYFKQVMKSYNGIKDVIFNDPATIVFWVDGSKTVVKCQKGETFDPEKGLAMAISKKVLGNDYGYYEIFAKHVGRYNKKKGKKDEKM